MSGRVVLLAMLAWALSAGGQTLYERASDRYDVDMHFYLDSVGQPGSRGVALRLPGTLNGRRATFTLDTGASVSVVSPRLLDRYGLHPTADSTLVEGTDTVVARRVVADSIELGNLTLRHVPFVVADAATGDDAYDRYLDHLQLIIGRPLLDVLGKTTVDFRSHTLTAPRRPKRRQKRTRRSNLAVVDNVLLVTASDTLQLIPDFGATHSSLDSAYFSRQSAAIVAQATPDTVSYVGIGGVVTAIEYTLDDFSLTIDRKRLTAPQVTVHATGGYESRLGLDFFTRQSRVVFDLRRWRLTVEP